MNIDAIEFYIEPSFRIISGTEDLKIADSFNFLLTLILLSVVEGPVSPWSNTKWRRKNSVFSILLS